MEGTEVGKSKGNRCSDCRRVVPDHDVVNLGSLEEGYRWLCTQCYNAEAARLGGLDAFEHVEFKPVGVVDCEGQAHEFHFRARLFGPGVALDAFELHDGEPGGYRFQVIGDPEADLLALLGRLIEKIRRALAIKHIRQGSYGWETLGDVVRGRLEWDEQQEGLVPLVVIDGQEITWYELGRLMRTFEGFQFRLEIRDMSDEV